MKMVRLGACIVLAVSATALCACNRSVSALETRPPPAPLPSSPLEPVQSGELSPISPSGSYDPNAPYDPTRQSAGAPPHDPANGGSGDGQMAASSPPPLPSMDRPAATGSGSLSREALAGTWTVRSDNPECRIILAFTKWSGGYRAATRRCNSPELASIAAWDVKENSVVLVDSAGTTVASLYASGAERYDGRTVGGVTVSLTR